MADDAARDALEQRFAEQLLDDESLRADLTDDEYQPIQDWALDRLHEQAVAVADPAAPEAETAMAAVLESLRRVLRAVDDTVGHRADRDAQAFTDGLAPLVEAVEPPLYTAEGPANDVRQSVQAAIPRLAAQKDDLDGPALVQELVAVLSGPGGGGAERDGVAESS
ncbi:MAG TPA: hypothetical protein VII06_26210 [Chloroflexota bacterium]